MNENIKAYLDYNIFTSIEDGEIVLETIIKNIDFKINHIPFSPGHIQEVDNITGKTSRQREEFIAKRLSTIKQITKCLYIHEDLANNVYFLTEEPKTVLETITEVPFAKSAMKMFTNLISNKEKEEFRNALGINQNQVNNYSSTEVVEHLNSKLTKWGSEYTLINIIESSISSHPHGKTYGLSNRIAAIVELIDMIGYWKDKETEKSNYARLWDSNHIFFASHCDYFVSDDKRARNKARVIYDIYNIDTKVVSSNGND